MQTLNLLEIVDKIYTRKKDPNSMLFGSLIGFIKEDLLNLDINDISYSKKNLADYYNVSISTLNNWIEIFVEEPSLKKRLLSRRKITSHDFIKLTKVIGSNNVFIFFDFKKLKNTVLLKDSYGKYVKYEYKSYQKKEMLALMDNMNSLDLSAIIAKILKIDSKKINKIPPKQSMQVIKKVNDYSEVSNSIVFFNYPEFNIPKNIKSKMSFDKKLKRFFKDRGVSDYEIKKAEEDF